MIDYRKNKPREFLYLVRDISEAVETVNTLALEHSGWSNSRYLDFLEEVINRLKNYRTDIAGKVEHL